MNRQNERHSTGSTEVTNNCINLSNLTDVQSAYLTQLSYLDIDTFGKRKSLKVGIKLYELHHFLANPNQPFCGSAMMDRETFEKMTIPFLGSYKLPTDCELLKRIVEMGLGNLVVIGVKSDARSGFQAIAFKDEEGNVGISFRGSDLDLSNGAIKDWVEADFIEYFTNDSPQRRRAIDFFNDNKSTSGRNYLFGHSLGGNLASHVYVECYNEIAGVFIINGYPINQSLLNTTEKIEAFNNSRYSYYSICGDIVSHLKSCELYKDNVRFVENNCKIKSSLLSAHLVQSALCNDYGEFEITTREEAMRSFEKRNSESIKVVQGFREILNGLELKLDHSKTRGSEAINKYKEELFGKLERIHVALNFDRRHKNSTVDCKTLESDDRER